MKKILLLLAIAVSAVGCSDDASTATTANPKALGKCGQPGTPTVIVPEYLCTPQVVDINAGQNILAGNVTIGNSASGMLYVTYNANANWKFTQLHLYVGTLSGVPQKNGNPSPGKFPYSATLNGTTTTYTFQIPLADVQKEANGCFVVAAHANMSKMNAWGNVIQCETGWAGYNDLSGNNWARYFDQCSCSQVAE